MFDEDLMAEEHNSPEKDSSGIEEAKVARPTTKPTDRTKKLGKQSYTFWTEKDKEKLNSFPQFADPSHIAPKKLEGIQNQGGPELKKNGSAWNKAGTTW